MFNIKMEFGKYALQRKVMKLKGREGISLKQAWKKVLSGKKSNKKRGKKSHRTGPCRSPLSIRDRRTGLCRRKKNLGPSLPALQQLAVAAGVPTTKKLANGSYGSSPVKRAVLKARLTKAGINYNLGAASLQPLVAPSGPPPSALPVPSFAGTTPFGFSLKACKRNQYRSPDGRCRLRYTRPCLHPGQVRDRKSLLCRSKKGPTGSQPNLKKLQDIAKSNDISFTKKLASGVFGASPVSSRTLKARLTRAGIAY